MKIIDIIRQDKPVFSFEFFPPKDLDGFDQLFKTIDNLKPWNPAFVSVTYGAGGSNRSKTIDLVGRIKKDIGLESMAHLTCVGHQKEEIVSVLESLHTLEIDNVLALRGDPPKGDEKFVKTEGGFGYANELVSLIKSKSSFCVGAACYPEGHIECPNLTIDMDNLKRKVDAGVDFLITQLFFDNKYYFDFIDKTLQAGINIPIIPGIMPILNIKQSQRFTKMCGATISDSLLAKFDGVQDDPEKVREIGINHAIDQCKDLLRSGAPGIHFYTLNRSKATLAILENLQG